MIKTEEKGSDVNLATYLLVDAFRNDADAFAGVSNDSDLTAGRVVKKQKPHQRWGLAPSHRSNWGNAHGLADDPVPGNTGQLGLSSPKERGSRVQR